MKIDYLKINGYGKISDKQIDLKNNINIIYGKNEAGKSTVLSFINSMFYGASKNKNGKNISIFDKYKPWKGEEFSGKIKYVLDDKETYEIFRDFKKKSPTIYDKNLNDISNNYNVDKTNGIDFLNEQIGIDENIFENTVITYQDEIKMNKSSQNTIIQRISNLVSSGDENISFKKTLDKINKLQNEQVGTNRTVGKPINLVNNKIDNLNRKKDELENYKKMSEYDENKLVELNKEINNETNKLMLFKRYKEELDNTKIDYTEIDVNKKVEMSYENKIAELENKKEQNNKDKALKEKEKKSFMKNYILIFIITFAILLINILKRVLVPTIILAVIDVLIIGLTVKKIVSFNKQKNAKIKEIEEFEKKINQEIEILNQNKNERKEQRIQKENEINEKIQNINKKLISEFLSVLSSSFIDDTLNMNYDELSVGIETKEERISDLKIEMNTKENERQSMNAKLDDLARVQEELENAEQEKVELTSLNNSYNIAKECMEIAYDKIRESISPEFTNELCSLIKYISNEKYKKVKFNDTEGLTVELDDGRYITAENLSIGTIDQMYLSLRISSLQTISKENMPIILDEAFAYFDNERLKNILEYINKNYKNKQVIIFTCSNREKDALEELGVNYNLISL